MHGLQKSKAGYDNGITRPMRRAKYSAKQENCRKSLLGVRNYTSSCNFKSLSVVMFSAVTVFTW